MDGPLCRLLESPRPHLRPVICFIRALSVRAVHYYLEDSVHRTSVNEAHFAGVERRRRSEGRAADGDRESSGGSTHGSHDHNLCSVVACRQCWIFFLRWRGGLLSFADSAAGCTEHLPRLVVLVEFCL